MNKLITEFIGTFFLMFIIILTGQPMAIGMVLAVMIFAGGHISGAHYNPAVTLAVMLRGRISTSEGLSYMAVQVAGAVVAVLTAGWLQGSQGAGVLQVDTPKALAAEIAGTLALAYVVLNVATSKDNGGNSFYGLAIGMTVFACATGLGKFSGGAFNPAVAIAACVAKAFAWSNVWIYLVGCFGGAAVAASVFRMNNPNDR